MLAAPPRPLSFTPATNITYASFALKEPPFISRAVRRIATGKRAEGLRYEQKVHSYLLSTFSDSFIPSPWLTFQRRNDPSLRYCQPDGIMLDIRNGRCTVIEIKYQHTSDAWWQLWHLYIPVLRHILKDFIFSAIEIVKWFDPVVHFPNALMLHDIRRPFPAPYTGVHIWKPRNVQ